MKVTSSYYLRNNFFYLFTDRNGDGLYTATEDEWVRTYGMGRGFTIDKICVPQGAAEDCSVDKVNILFKRPEPDAIISFDNGEGFNPTTRVRFVLKSPRDDLLSVLVETAGQISVQRYVE